MVECVKGGISRTFTNTNLVYSHCSTLNIEALMRLSAPVQVKLALFAVGIVRCWSLTAKTLLFCLSVPAVEKWKALFSIQQICSFVPKFIRVQKVYTMVVKVYWWTVSQLVCLCLHANVTTYEAWKHSCGCVLLFLKLLQFNKEQNALAHMAPHT